MNNSTLHTLLSILKAEYPKWKVPVVTLIAERSNDPYQVLISTVLSLRTKDEVTIEASRSLFARATTPAQMLKLSAETIQQLIYPTGFYKTKSENLRRISQILLDEYAGNVPDNLDALLKLPGVGRKTANLTITLGFGKPGICVDTHVHRISNRFGYIKTKTPDESEMVLREKLPQEWWIPINDILVAFGQGICKPISPFCSKCKVSHICERHGVGKSR
ncbi:endonuclease III [bacterium]|nr:endonuclease III [bacterium]